MAKVVLFFCLERVHLQNTGDLFWLSDQFTINQPSNQKGTEAPELSFILSIYVMLQTIDPDWHYQEVYSMLLIDFCTDLES